MTFRRASRRAALALVLALTAAPALAAISDPQPDDMSLGDAKARLTVIEYASVGCPHCAKWNNEVFGDLKKTYIDKGKVRFVVREMLTGDGAVATAGFMLARCAGPAKYFQVVDAIYQRQASMYQAGSSRGAVLADIAKGAGLSDDAYKDCLDSQAGLDAFNARADRHYQQDKVDSTPTFFIGDARLAQELTLADVAKALKAPRRRG